MDPILKNLPAARATILPPALPTARLCYEDADNILQKVSSDGGPSQKAFDLPVFSRITISPDGKLAAFVTQRGADSKEKLALLPLDSSQPARFLEFERPRSAPLRVRLQLHHQSSGFQLRWQRDGLSHTQR